MQALFGRRSSQSGRPKDHTSIEMGIKLLSDSEESQHGAKNTSEKKEMTLWQVRPLFISFSSYLAGPSPRCSIELRGKDRAHRLSLKIPHGPS